MKRIWKDLEPQSQEWLKARKQGLGGSDAGTVLGVNPYASPYALWAVKTGLVEDTFKGNQATKLGNALERPVLEEYARSNNLRILVCKWSAQSVEYPFMRANFDAFLTEDETFIIGVTDVDPETLEATALKAYVEVKTAGLTSRSNKDAWFSTRGCPENYYWQIVHCCALMGLNEALLIALVGGSGIVERGYFITTEDFEHLLDVERNFWEMVEKKERPKVIADDVEILKEIYPVSDGTTVEVDEFVADCYLEWKKAKDELDQADQKVKRLRAQLEVAVGNADQATFNGDTLFTYKSNKVGLKFDEKRFKEENPDMHESYLSERNGARVLREKM